LVGENVEQLLKIKGGESSRSLLNRLLEETKATAIEGISAIQEIIPLEVSVTNLETSAADRTQQRLLVTMIDITERYKLELLKRDFVAMVSHDIRTPLTSMQAIISLIRGGNLGAISPETAAKLAVAEGNGNHLLQLVGKLLDLEKLDSGLAELMFADFQIKNLIEAAVNLVSQEASNKSLAIKIIAGKEKGSGDIDSLVQVLTNLLSNAVRYSPAGSEIEVSVSQRDDLNVIRVRDSGPGIPSQKQSEIFERFKQADSDRDRKQGFGLGLAICAAIIKQHDQKLGVDSELGQGSTFWFTVAKAAGDNPRL
jgi:signal transduction histidine kinase